MEQSSKHFIKHFIKQSIKQYINYGEQLTKWNMKEARMGQHASHGDVMELSSLVSLTVDESELVPVEVILPENNSWLKKLHIYIDSNIDKVKLLL